MDSNHNLQPYTSHFNKLAETGNWNMNTAGGHTAFRFLPTVDEFSRQNLIYLESLVIDFSTPAGFYMKRKGYHSYQIQYTTAGQGRLIYDNNEYILSAGDCFFIDCQIEHHFYTINEEPWIHHGIQLNGHQLPELFKEFYKNNSVKLSFKPTDEISFQFEKIADACHSQLASSGLVLNQLLTNLITKILLYNQNTSKGELSEKIKNVCNYIERNFDKINGIDEIAKNCYISKYYLCREFKRQTGHTLMRYLNQIRINTAKYLLLSTDMPISDISIEVGYHSVNYFHSIFRQIEKTTPLHYRHYTGV